MSLFVNHYNYTVGDFDLLTPVQAHLILSDRSTIDESKMMFWVDQLRTVNFFTIKSAMGDTKRIKEPSDLYSLPTDTKQPVEVKPIILTDTDISMIQQLLDKQSN